VLHVGDADSRIGCSGFPPSVEAVVTSAEAAPEGLPYYVYVLGAPDIPPVRDLRDYEDMDLGLSGLRFGIEYGASDGGEGLHVFSWQSCTGSSLTDGRWPETGAGITLTWGSCAETGLAVGGYFYVAAYSPSVMSVVPFPGKPAVAYADCSAREGDFVPLDIHRVGWLSMGGAMKGLDSDGCNPLLGPCNGPTDVEQTTWGSLKARYKSGN
jgi:hypothetical protein